MRRTTTILLGALLFAGAPLAVTNAADIVISIGDRPYYTHGPFYVENGVRWVWVPGHWARKHKKRVWVHGHYARR
ncbi:MAG: YXWGXW repeat-containing protein [Chthoniobacterales bacterium]|nr:YXWGXW repeat-containing protein [Chthoniobacterales bacterium]